MPLSRPPCPFSNSKPVGNPLHTLLMLFVTAPAMLSAQEPAGLPFQPNSLPPLPASAKADWLLQTPPTRESGVFRGPFPGTISLDNGIIRRTFVLTPNLATVGMQQLYSGQSLLRAIRPECRITINGIEYEVGGATGQAVENFLTAADLNGLIGNANAFQLRSMETSHIVARMPWKPREAWLSAEVAWPPRGSQVTFRFAPPASEATLAGIDVAVHYTIYDGLPLIGKHITISNHSTESIQVNRFTSEILACVEASSQVEELAAPLLPNLHVETDYTTCSMHGGSAQVDAVHWSDDPDYLTQVNYRRQARCLLEVHPEIGPEVLIPVGQTFQSFRTWILAFDDREENRQALALAKMYRTLAPWTLENPLIHHVRQADDASVKLAIDQCADVGFEMVIMTFGSGFSMEDDSQENLDRIRSLVDYAHGKRIALGGYSLLASRSIDKSNDVINPATGEPGGFARFGNSPCLQSEWGRAYFDKLKHFYEVTGADVLEHDGSYPGDCCASTHHPGHDGLADSRWRQREIITDFYQWCRGRGVYLNVPDWYFLNGSNKTGMGYRETNWSLPREHQEIIERQNIADGTRFKGPTMGWMFVPLTEYHGGGDAATIEPLAEHIDHYRRRLENLLGAGVQACFRGPRLYDTEATRKMVRSQVAWYKAHRAILDSPLVLLRRADGQDWDGWIHVNPALTTPALAVVYNPLDAPIQRTLSIPLYYAGLTKAANVSVGGGPTRMLTLDRQERATVDIEIPARGMAWLEFSAVQQPDSVQRPDSD